MEKIEVMDSIKENVEKKDIKALKSNIKVIINFDKNFSRGYAKVNLDYIKNHGINLYESYDNKGLMSSKPQNEYTDRDYTDAIFYLTENFCNERLEDVKKIGEILYKVNPQEIDTNKEKITIAKKSQCGTDKRITTVKKFQLETDKTTKTSNKKLKGKKIAIAFGIGVTVVALGIIYFAIAHQHRKQ